MLFQGRGELRRNDLGGYGWTPANYSEPNRSAVLPGCSPPAFPFSNCRANLSRHTSHPQHFMGQFSLSGATHTHNHPLGAQLLFKCALQPNTQQGGHEPRELWGKDVLRQRMGRSCKLGSASHVTQLGLPASWLRLRDRATCSLQSTPRRLSILTSGFFRRGCRGRR